MAYQELITIYSLPNASTITSPEAEIIISTSEKSLHKPDSNPKLMISRIVSDSVNKKLPLCIVRERFTEYTDSKYCSDDSLDSFLQSIEKEADAIVIWWSSLRYLLLTAHDRVRQRCYLIFIVAEVMGRSYRIWKYPGCWCIRYLTKWVQDTEEQADKVRK